MKYYNQEDCGISAQFHSSILYNLTWVLVFEYYRHKIPFDQESLPHYNVLEGSKT